MYAAFASAVLAAYRTALARALPPPARVARHWEDASRLTWLGLLQEQARFQVAWSFGRLSGAPPEPLQTAGVFHLVGAAFPGVDEAALARGAMGLVPTTVDGPTRAFLVRVVCQLALEDAAHALRAPGALPMPTAPGFEVVLPVRADALTTPASQPVVPAHAADRVWAAVALLGLDLGSRVQAAFAPLPGPAPFKT